MHKVLLIIVILLSACATKPPQRGEKQLDAKEASAEVNYQRASQYYQHGNLDQALQTAEQNVKIYPDHAYTHQLIGLINQKLGHNTHATQSMAQALRLAPKDAGIANNYASLLCARKNYAKAEKYYLAAANYPNNTQPEIAWTNAGLCALRAGQNNKAKSFFEQAITVNPEQTPALYQLAKLALKSDHIQAANAYLEKYLQHDTHTAKTLLLAAKIENAQHNAKGVEAYLGMLRATFPYSAEKTAAEQLTPIDTKKKAGNSIDLPSAHSEQWVINRPPSHYTILVASNKKKSIITEVAQTVFPEEKAIYSVTLGGKRIYNLITGDFPSFNAAQIALAKVKQAAPDYKPWIRTFESIQALLKTSAPSI